MLTPNWLDAVIQPQLPNGAVAIAQAILQSPQVLDAINTALRRPLQNDGPSRAQAVREEIKRVLCS